MEAHNKKKKDQKTNIEKNVESKKTTFNVKTMKQLTKISGDGSGNKGISMINKHKEIAQVLKTPMSMRQVKAVPQSTNVNKISSYVKRPIIPTKPSEVPDKTETITKDNNLDRNILRERDKVKDTVSYKKGPSVDIKREKGSDNLAVIDTVSERETLHTGVEFTTVNLANAESAKEKGGLLLFHDTEGDIARNVLAVASLNIIGGLKNNTTVDVEFSSSFVGLKNYYSVYLLSEDGTYKMPPKLFNIKVTHGDELNDTAFRKIGPNSAIQEFGIGYRTITELRTGVAVVEYEFEPSGYEHKIENPCILVPEDEADPISELIGHDSQFSSYDDIRLVVKALKFINALFLNSDMIISSPSPFNLDVDAGTLAIRNDEHYFNMLRMQNNKFLDSNISINPLYAFLFSADEKIRRIIMEAFEEQGIQIDIGQFDERRYELSLVSGKLHITNDIFSTAILNINHDSFENNILTYDVFQLLVNALKFPTTIVDILDIFIPNVNMRHMMTNEEVQSALFLTFLNVDNSGYFITNAHQMIIQLGVFKELPDKVFFIQNANARISAGSSSNMLSDIVRRYDTGDLKGFLKLMVAEFFSYAVTLDLSFSAIDSTYVTLFGLFDILLWSLCFPKLFWSNSASFGRQLTTIMASVFPEQYRIFQAAHGTISLLQDGVWVRTGLVVITQDQVLNGYQYSILVNNAAQRLGNDVVALFSIARRVIPLFGRIDIQRKRDAGFPVAQDLRDYTSSWPQGQMNTHNAFSVRFNELVEYFFMLIKKSQQLSSTLNVKKDASALNGFRLALVGLATDIANVFTVFGNIVADVIANSYLCPYEYFNMENYMIAQPRIALQIQNMNGVARAPVKLINIPTSATMSTFACLYIRHIGYSIDVQESLHSRATGELSHPVSIPPLDTNGLIKIYFEYFYKMKKDLEKLFIILRVINIREQEVFAFAIRTFRSNLNNHKVNALAHHTAESLNTTVFNDIIASIDSNADTSSYDFRGNWTVCLTDSSGTENFNNRIEHNLVFGVPPVFMDEWVEAKFQLINHLAFSRHSPILKEVRQFYVTRQKERYLSPDNEMPVRNYTEIINFRLRQQIARKRRVIHPDGTSDLMQQLELGAHVYDSITDIVRAGHRFLIVVPNSAYFCIEDHPTIYNMIMSEVLDIHYTDTRLRYTTENLHVNANLYENELIQIESWIYNKLLKAISSRTLLFHFFDTRVPIKNELSFYVPVDQYVYAIEKIDNIIMKNLYSNENIEAQLPPQIRADVWQTSRHPLTFPDDVSILDRRDMNFSPTMPFITSFVTDVLPNVKVTGGIAMT